MVGSALTRRLRNEGCEILTTPRETVDLTDRRAVRDWALENRPDAVFCAAAKVGGIAANDAQPVAFLIQNLEIELSVIEASHAANVRKLVFLGSSCIYPREAPQPIPESALLSGPLERTNEWYAVAKIAGIKMCQAYQKQYDSRFVSAMPTNLYGPGDNYHPTDSHVVAALIRKAHEAKVGGHESLTIWGSGTPRREFLHADDCADALVYLMEHYEEPEPINVGVGWDISIRGLAEAICDAVGFDGLFVFDTEKPDGTPRKLLDVSRLKALGWRPSIDLNDGLRDAYEDFHAREYDEVPARRA